MTSVGNTGYFPGMEWTVGVPAANRGTMMDNLSKCPACGAPLEKHTPETASDYEWWGFECEAEVIRMDGGKFAVETGCGAALQNALNRMNAALPSREAQPRTEGVR